MEAIGGVGLGDDRGDSGDPCVKSMIGGERGNITPLLLRVRCAPRLYSSNRSYNEIARAENYLFYSLSSP